MNTKFVQLELDSFFISIIIKIGTFKFNFRPVLHVLFEQS
jgi:hypothetical protein